MMRQSVVYFSCVALLFGLSAVFSRSRQTFFLLVLLTLLLPCLILILWLVTAACIPRKLRLNTNSSNKEFIGSPFLFPAKLSHARRFPQVERYNYWYDYFMVGVPVGLRGRIGNLLSIDNMPSQERLWEKCWFTIDPTYYLDRGSGSRCLEEKLHVFLESVNEDPRDYPYAYLLSVPRFLWWQKSAISYWYLYSSSRELTAIIMEINNSFFEKRNFFFRLTGTGSSKEGHQEGLEHAAVGFLKGPNLPHRLTFHTSLSKWTNYKGSWEKLILGSPFEKVGGTMAAKFADPLTNTPPALQSILSALTPDGQVKVTSRLSSWGTAVNPLSSTSWDIIRFISRWTHVGAVSAPRIVKEALKVRFRGNLKYLQRPEVRKGSIPRKETEIEAGLELIFREYLLQLVLRCPIPLTVKYKPPKSIHFDAILFHSPVIPTSDPRPVVEIHPLTPRFYTSLTQYRDAKQGFISECTSQPTNSDDSSCRLWLSDLPLLIDVLERAGPTMDDAASKQSIWVTTGFKHPISWLRGSSETTFMDRFTYSYSSFHEQWTYQKCVIHHLLSLRLPIESQAVVQLGYILIRTLVVYGLLSIAFEIDGFGIWLDYRGINPGTWSIIYAGWDLMTSYIGKYYLNPFAWGEGL